MTSRCKAIGDFRDAWQMIGQRSSARLSRDEKIGLVAFAVGENIVSCKALDPGTPTLIAPPPANVNRFLLSTYTPFKSQATRNMNSAIETSDSEIYQKNTTLCRISFGFCILEGSENLSIYSGSGNKFPAIFLARQRVTVILMLRRFLVPATTVKI